MDCSPNLTSLNQIARQTHISVAAIKEILRHELGEEYPKYHLYNTLSNVLAMGGPTQEQFNRMLDEAVLRFDNHPYIHLEASRSEMQNIIKSRSGKMDEVASAIAVIASDEIERFIKEQKLPKFRTGQLTLPGTKPYVSRGDKEFRYFEVGKASYEAVIYKVICKLPSKYVQYSGKPYIGFTNNFNLRILSHIKGALNPNVENYKFADAIYSAFEEEGLNPEVVWNEILNSKGAKYRFVIENCLKVFNKYFSAEVIEYHVNYYTVFAREKYYINGYDSIKNGLNSILGGGGVRYQPLPLYDVIYLICLGHNLVQVTEKINDMYEDLAVSRNTVTARLSEIASFGSFYQAQEELLRPVIERLLEEGIDAYKVFNYFREKGLARTRYKASWFSSWAFGKAILRDGITRYFGIPHSQWERFIIEDWKYEEIENKYGLTEDNIKKAMGIFGGKNKAMKSLRISRTLLLLKEDWSLEQIYYNDFKCTGTDPQRYFRGLFKGFSGIDRRWSPEEIVLFAKSNILPK